MKEKHQGLLVLAITGTALLVGVAQEMITANQLRGSVQMIRPSITPDFNVPNPSEMAYLKFLKTKLPYLVQADGSRRRTDLTLFGAVSSSPAQTEIAAVSATSPNAKEKKATEDIFSDYSLTLCFTAPTRRFCVINGTLYKEGAQLHDGGRILKIENDRVLISKQKRKDWIVPLNQRDILVQDRER
ncbi:MAG: hypothetical protein CSA29_00640 [Desulfobacterales bacterium]|nr:MAG: hypothetical protein CSA29_00640 [Desulfobacterales bacterium]